MPQVQVIRTCDEATARAILEAAARVTSDLDVAPDLLPIAFTKAVDLLGASHVLAIPDAPLHLPAPPSLNGRRT